MDRHLDMVYNLLRKTRHNVHMKKNNCDKALTRALATLREITQKLAHGVEKARFEQEYRGKYVSPGVSVNRHVEELRISGSLDEKGTSMKLR